MDLRTKYGFDKDEKIPEPFNFEIIEGTNRNNLGVIARKLRVYVDSGPINLVVANFKAIREADKDVHELLIDYFNLYDKYVEEYNKFLEAKKKGNKFSDDYLLNLHDMHDELGQKRTAPFMLVYLRYPDSKYIF